VERITALPKEDEGKEEKPVTTPATKPDAGAPGGTPPTQEELDRQFAERAKHAQEAERKRLLESFGVANDDELKAIVAAKKEADNKAKTELQKQADKAAAAEARAAKLETENAQKMAEMQKRLLDSEIKQLAVRPVTDKDGKVTRAAFRSEALEAALLMIDRSGIADKDGKYEGIEKALDALAKANGYMLVETTSQQAAPKGTPRTGSPKLKTSGSEQETDDEPMFNSL
jgi:membrane protein involved in colicin uptake